MTRASLPCPIPRCALEWVLAFAAAITGASVWLSGDPRLGHYDISLLFLNVPMSSARWGIALGLVAVLQWVALGLRPMAPQCIAAGLASFAWVAFALSTYHGGMIAVASPIAVLFALSQLYVCGMLWGGRWTG